MSNKKWDEEQKLKKAIDTLRNPGGGMKLVSHGFMKTCTVRLDVKDPDELGRLRDELKLDDDVVRKHFEFGECATLELEIDADLRVLSGRIVPFREKRR